MNEEERIKRYHEIRQFLLGEILIWNKGFYTLYHRVLEKRARETLHEGIEDPLVKLVLKYHNIGEGLRKVGD